MVLSPICLRLEGLKIPVWEILKWPAHLKSADDMKPFKLAVVSVHTLAWPCPLPGVISALKVFRESSVLQSTQEVVGGRGWGPGVEAHASEFSIWFEFCV